MYIGLEDLTPNDHSRLRARVRGEIAVLHEESRTATKGVCRFVLVGDTVWVHLRSSVVVDALRHELSAHVGQRHDGWLLEFRGTVCFDDSRIGRAALIERHGTLDGGHVAMLAVRQVVRIELS